MIEDRFDVPFIAELAKREKQIQQNYRPVIAIHKWFARRPGTLFRGLLLSEFGDNSNLRESFYQANNLSGVRIADPFMGGGTPLLEANRMGCDVVGFDINPMSYWIVKQELDHLDLHSYQRATGDLLNALAAKVGDLYKTQCGKCGSKEAHVKYFLWVKTETCGECGEKVDLFPGYLIARDVRHPKNVLVCPDCGVLNEVSDRSSPGKCSSCGGILRLEGPARNGSSPCSKCGSAIKFPSNGNPPVHRLFAIEYYCPNCKSRHKGRFFKQPDEHDLNKISSAQESWEEMSPRFIPDSLIPSGDETNRLHRWGYKYYKDMFNFRQLLGLEESARFISEIQDMRVRHALATNLSDLVRYQNMLCRYDTTALKSLDVFSVHGFPVGLIQCESNILGIVGEKAIVGSGGWANITEKYRRAKEYCEKPFEILHNKGKKQIVHIQGEWIGSVDTSQGAKKREVILECRDSAKSELPNNSLDAVFTDPPYFRNVQYAELMDFCYVWLKKIISIDEPEVFGRDSTRNQQELTINEDMGRGLEMFTEGISTVFTSLSRALKKGSPFAFTYHHNEISAYYPIAVAILDAGLVCTKTIPCPAEMGASIHINGTGSSTIDTVFVCRSAETSGFKENTVDTKDVALMTKRDVEDLKAAGVAPTLGDLRCISYGHLVRLAIGVLGGAWDRSLETEVKIMKVDRQISKLGEWSEILQSLETEIDSYPFKSA